MPAFQWGRWERLDPQARKTQDAIRTMRWWSRVEPIGPWVFVATTGFGPNMTWGATVPVMAVLPGARIVEPETVRLARRHLERTT